MINIFFLPRQTLIFDFVRCQLGNEIIGSRHGVRSLSSRGKQSQFSHRQYFCFMNYIISVSLYSFPINSQTFRKKWKSAHLILEYLLPLSQCSRVISFIYLFFTQRCLLGRQPSLACLQQVSCGSFSCVLLTFVQGAVIGDWPIILKKLRKKERLSSCFDA